MSSRFEKRLAKLARPPVLQKYFAVEGEFPETLPQARLREFQMESLREVIARAYERSAFYHDKMARAGVTPGDIHEFADLSRIPFTTKDELRGKPWALLACDKQDIALVQVSTGTTGGDEIYIMYSWEDFYLHDLAPGYPSLVPVEHGDICFNALPYEMSSAGLAFHKTFIESCGATVIPGGKGGAYSTPAKSVKMMRDLQPTILITTPSWAVYLAEAAEEAGLELKELPLKKMWLTGEGCSPAFRERIERIWGTVANFYYGSLECGCIGIECDVHQGYHTTQGHIYVEIVDPRTGQVLEPGEIGEIVVTCLLRYDTPLLRYRTQDLGYIDPEPCRCGVLMPRLFLRGRLVDQLEIRGTSFSPYYLEEFLMRLPEVGNWYQFVPGEEDLLIRCELAAGITPGPGLAESLASRMEYSTGVPCRFELVDSLPRPSGKTVRVIH
ncbi:phenylacetate-CoA ligase [Hydrogenispora ethanolica]|uniref:Phenylacetate-CoA ligase n=1 Tax=Hydrogenispora ethanolica TaxID=1082276 RepID=A0A4R1SBN8_HYDET|nr:AMP-binding protein [Hydrogenispora ethanolica]TCL76908.1 phenylacetate-CoA ligase [Hydrogenispora ethanolica]